MTPSVLKITVVFVLSATAILAAPGDPASSWWPEREGFKPSGGTFREKLSPQQTYTYDAADARIIPPDHAAAASPAKPQTFEGGAQLTVLGNREMAFWTLGAIQPGKYYLGVQVCSGNKTQPDVAQGAWYYITRINGLAIDFCSLDAPVLIAPDRYAAEMQSAETVELKPGDRISIEQTNGDMNLFGKLTLYSQPPKRGPIFRVPGYLTSGRRELWTSTLSVGLTAGSTTEAAAGYSVRNLANAPAKLELEVRVMDYFGHIVAQHSESVRLEDLAAHKGQLAFAIGQAPRYRATLSIRGQGDSGLVGRPSTDVAVFNAEVLQGLRQTMSLDGQWQQTRMPGLIEIPAAPEAAAQWKPYWVPGMMEIGCFKDLPKGCKDIHVGWAKRTFEVPQRMMGRRLLLDFDRLSEEDIVYVNGQRVGRHFGLYVPTVVDITPVVRAGQNELLIGVRDTVAYIDPQVLKANGAINAESCNAMSIAPSFAHYYGQTGVIGHARLASRGAMAVDTVGIQTSTRKNEIQVDLTVTNGSQAPCAATVAPVVKDDGKDVLALAPQQVQLAAGASQTLHFASAMANPHCWFLEDPHFYELAVSVSDGSQEIDRYRERFGFHEFYAQDGLFMLNGRPAKVSSMPREEGGSFNRHTAPSIDDLMDNDERGYMTSFAAPWCVGPREYNLESELYWQNAEAFAKGIVQAFRNHPSVAMWEASNEFACFCFTIGVKTPGGAIALVKKRLSHLGGVLRQTDPSRLVFFSSDGDLLGWADTCSLHYPLDHVPLDRGTPKYIPDGYLFRAMDKLPTPGDDLQMPQGSFPITAKYRYKPIMMDEIGQFSIYVVNDPTIVGGEAPYSSSAGATSYWQSIVDGYILDGARDIESSHYQPWSHPYGSGTTKLTFPLRYVVALDYMGNWRGGEKASFQTNIHHDILWPEKVTVRWALRGPDGAALAQGVLGDREFGPSELVRTRIEFVVPQVQQETRCRFVLEVLKDGQVEFSRDKGFVIYPAAPPAVNLAKRIGLYDPQNKAQKALDLLGVKRSTLTAMDAAALAGVDVLLIGPDAMTAAAAEKYAADVQAFVAAGGRVVVFEHDQPVRWLPYLVNSDRARQASFTFPRIADHPILKGIDLEDLRLWRDNRVVSRHDFLKTSRGSILPIIDGGGMLGLEWASVIEVYFGQGSYVLSQMLLCDRAGVDPCAAKLLANVLNYCGQPLYRQKQTVALVAPAKSSLVNLADRLAASVKLVAPDKPADLAGCQAALVDASAEPSADEAQQVLEIARGGGKVVLHALTDKSAIAWGKALGCRIELRPIHDYYRGRAIRRDWDGLLAGLSMHEMHWHQNAGGDDSSFDVKFRIAELAANEIVTDAPGAVLCTYPAVFVSIPLGQGRLLLDQVEWDTAGDMVGNWARRIASTLLTNLGAEFRPVPPARKIDGPLAYVPIDLSKFVNRPMADEVADDGEGGWSDQGPRLDGRQFPTGRVVARGIPFFIGATHEVKPTDKTVIVLDGGRFKEPCSAVKGIPVGRKVQTLHFLHTAAWAGESVPMMSYMVNYDDGTFEEIRVVSGINSNDWWLPTGDRDFLEEIPGVSTQVGLVSENPTFECVGAYLMQWINPHPEKTVATVDCLYRAGKGGMAIPIVLGISAGVKAGEAPPAAEGPKGDTPKAMSLTAQAEDLITKAQYDQAQQLLQQACAADPACGRAAFMLGRASRLGKNIDQAVKAYRIAAGLMPENTEVLNELAALLEAQGKRIQASAVYRQSLRVNWNQPPIMDAVNRLR